VRVTFDVVLEPDLRLVVEPADSRVSRMLLEGFFADIALRYPGWEPAASTRVDPSELAPPSGTWIVAYVSGRAIGCGGLQRVDRETAEIRRIFLDRPERGRGVGRALLAELEMHAGRLGYQRLRLTTGDRQTEALELFRTAGYVETAPFSEGVFTRYWMQKPLG
jgi:GNAT superfamily N-acetyltransferase